MNTDRLSGAALLLFAVLVGWESRRLPLGTHHGPGPGYFPLLLAAILALLAVVIVVRGRGAGVASLSWEEAPRALAILGAAAFAAVALERVGYRLTVLAVLVVLLGLVERGRPWLVIPVALGVTFGSYWVFHTLLRVPLPRGPFGL